MSLIDKKPCGLRQRKKEKTRAAIQRQALRLFRRKGYNATTIDEIAAAAEVSPSTFFRYFPTKEDVVIWDDFDPLIVKAFEAQPAALSPARALRNAMKSVFAGLSEKQLQEQKERTSLLIAVPELRSRLFDQFAEMVQMMAGVLAARTGHDEKDPEVRNLAGALIGVLMAAVFTAADNPEADILEIVYASLEHLEAGLPL